MKNCLSLIGMPGSGKSTLGRLLADRLEMDFIDTDDLIKASEGKSLQEIVDSDGYLELRKYEAREILALSLSNQVIATGGSAVYGYEAMMHLQKNSTIIYLETSLEELARRIKDLVATRGIAKPSWQSFEEVFLERTPLYKRYSEVVVNCDRRSQDQILDEIMHWHNTKSSASNG